MLEKVTHYVEWGLFIVGIVITGFWVLRFFQGLVFGIICLSVCVDKTIQPTDYWLFMVFYIAAVPVLVYSVKRSWKTINSRKAHTVGRQ